MLEGAILTASKDQTRPHLNGVLFKFDRETMTVVSTDGHRLTKVMACYSGEELGPNESAKYLIPLDRVLGVLKAVKGPARVGQEPIQFDLHPKHVSITLLNGDEYTCTPVDENFPPYDKVIPGERDTDGKEGANVIGVSAKYLGDVGKAGRYLAHVKSGGVQFSVDGNRDPIRIDMVNTDLGTETVIVIMPMRV
jgi:DNA polymerase-3 subunit beta